MTDKRQKTGGRQKGTGGRRVFITIPPEIAKQLPDSDKEAREVILEMLRRNLETAEPDEKV